MPLIENIPGATPIDDISALIPTHITTHSELNEWESANILKAATKYLTVRDAAKRLDLTEERVRELIVLKQIKAVKVGKWRIKPEDLEKFIKSRSNL